MSVVLYLRRSVDDDATSAHTRHTIETQRAACRKYAAEHGLTIIAEFVDDDVSGAMDPAKRAGFAGVLRSLSRDVGLLAHKADRISRDTGMMSTLLARLARRGVQLHLAAKGRIAIETATGRTMALVESLLGQHERAVVGERVAATLAHLKETGQRYGEIPYGMRSTEGGSLVADEHEQLVIAEIRALRRTGLALRGIVATLDERGRVSRSGRPLGLTQVVRVLTHAEVVA